MKSPGPSPEQLRGASCTTGLYMGMYLNIKAKIFLGGLFRGRALGNRPNLDDEDTFETQMAAPAKGAVYLYVSHANPSNLGPGVLKPMAFVKIIIEKSIRPILDALAKKYQPLAGMC